MPTSRVHHRAGCQSSFLRMVPLALAACIALGYLGVVLLGSSTTVASSPQSGKKPPYKPVVDLDIIMHQVDEVYSDLEERIEKKHFRTLRKQGLFLAEMMNIAMYFDATKYSKAKGWEEISIKTRDLLIEFADAAKKKDEAGVTGMYEKFDASCESCHEKYRDI